jgi:mycothiol synthase
MNLPDGMTSRPLDRDDIDAIVAMVNRCELHDSGEILWERADLIADTGDGIFDPARDWLGVFDADELVALAFLQGPRNLWIEVGLGHRGRGLATSLRGWALERAREAGHDRVAQIIDDRRSEVGRALVDAGFAPAYTSWILRLDHTEEPLAPEPPERIELRPARLPDEEIEALAMFEAAFSEWPDRPPSTVETWRAVVTHREGFRPDDLVVAVDGGRIVGGAFLIDVDEIWIDKLAVATTHRHRGIARALLRWAFRRSFASGYDHTTLSTDSRTGALALYEAAGMQVTRSFTSWQLDL